jgi:hypothetical protein
MKFCNAVHYTLYFSQPIAREYDPKENKGKMLCKLNLFTTLLFPLIILPTS